MTDLAEGLAERRIAHLYRRRLVNDGPQQPVLTVDGQRLLSFCSNDYLGLANHPRLVAALRQGADLYGLGSGASHLVSGHCRAHHDLEEALAAYTGQPRVLLFSTGYMANLAVVATLVQRHCVVYLDRLAHASLIDAARLSGAPLHRYAHTDNEALQRRLESDRPPRAYIATDGVFSMDGDIAPLDRLLHCAQNHAAWLHIDDAHGLGVIGPQGRGSLALYEIAAAEKLILVGTLGKAFGSFGAFVAGSEDLIETLIQQARPYIYTTALPPAVAHATLTSLQLVESESWRREYLHNLIERFRNGALERGLPVADSSTPIQPIVIGDNERAMQASESLRSRGLLITAIRPPTVPAGTARLRITLSAGHKESDIDFLLDMLSEIL